MRQSACKKYFCTALIAVILKTLCQTGHAQEIPFIPPVYNYTTSNYRAGNQNWSVAQGSNNVIYTGNNNGLLSFEGINWKLHRLPNNLSVKSIYIDSESSPERIYVGSFEEFGFFEPDETNQLIYHSVKNLVKDYTFHNDEIWTIHPFNGRIYFQSFSAVFVYDGKEVSTLKPNPAVLYFFPVNGKMFAQLINNDFYHFDGSKFHHILSRDQLKDDNVVAVLPFNDEYLLVTSKSGLYRFSENTQTLTPWETSIEPDLREAIINRAIFSANEQYIFGTLNDGLFAIDRKGNKLWHINRSNGLNNNTILALYSDREHNIWVALDNGISYIRTQSPFTFFEPSDVQIGLVEDILFHRNNLYLATNQGIYHYSEVKKNFSRLPEFDTQSWFIRTFGNQIFVGHNLGSSLLGDGKETAIPEARTGGMDIKQAVINRKNVLLESSYTSLYVYSQTESGNWEFSHRVEGFMDLIKNLEIDHAGNIWAGHMYMGVYRLRLDNALRNVVEIENYQSLDSTKTESTDPVKVMKLKGRIVFTDGKRFYTYDDIHEKIIPYDLLNKYLPDFADTYRIVSVNDTLHWFIRNTEYALVSSSGDTYSLKDRIPYSILNNPPNMGRANVYVADEHTTYFCLNGGIGKYVFTEESSPEKSILYLSLVEYYDRNNDRTYYLNPREKAIVAYKYNDIGFQFMYPEYSKSIFRIECFLDGYDSRWVNTAEDLSISYNNLPAGEYILKARVRDNSGAVLSTVGFTFRIKNPWYKTWWAYLSYALIILFITVLLIENHVQKVVQRKNKLFTEQENRRLAQLDRQEKEITALRNEKLESDLTYKSKELASATMMIINHTEFLKNLRTLIQSDMLAGKINRTEGNQLVTMIGKNLSEEDAWTVFQENFDLIHENFFRKLKERYPALTPTDLKLCTLLRLNYSSKEIAGMMNISIRGVEAARYRLRKKLLLSESDNLVEFMINFK
ncbi:MAG: hypothetical protein LLF80_09410 [Porphyromonadaceae bacterium]|nr:hypothetical protein [Porphyromonadaceae bacterium]